MKINRYIQTFWPWRWWHCLRALGSGVRLHPSVHLYGNTNQIKLGYGTAIGARGRLDAGAAGRIVTGDRVWMSSDVEIETDTEVRIGDGTTIQRRCTINGSTRIGAGCIFAPNVFVSSGTHPFRAIAHLPIREQERRIVASSVGLNLLDHPIWIQDDCWLGTNVVICPGVTIGKGSVVGANCVVTRDIPPYSVVGGVPGQVIGQRLDWIPAGSIWAENEKDQPYVLSGRLIKGDGDRPTLLEASFDTPLCFAFDAGSEALKLILQWNTQAPVQIEIGDRTFSLDAGSGELELPLDVLETVKGVHYCTVSISGPTPSAVLYVSQIFVRAL